MYRLYVIPGSHACRAAMLMLDHKRVRIFPTPQSDATGYGDYRQDVPTLPSGDVRVDWPAGYG